MFVLKSLVVGNTSALNSDTECQKKHRLPRLHDYRHGLGGINSGIGGKQFDFKVRLYRTDLVLGVAFVSFWLASIRCNKRDGSHFQFNAGLFMTTAPIRSYACLTPETTTNFASH